MEGGCVFSLVSWTLCVVMSFNSMLTGVIRDWVTRLLADSHELFRARMIAFALSSVRCACATKCKNECLQFNAEMRFFTSISQHCENSRLGVDRQPFLREPAERHAEGVRTRPQPVHRGHLRQRCNRPARSGEVHHQVAQCDQGECSEWGEYTCLLASQALLLL